MRLKKKYVLSPLSNGDVACLVNMARHGGLPWDCILCAIALLGCEPGETMLVAAHNYDLRAARSHGMRTAFVPRPLEYGPSQKSDLVPEEDWDVVARDYGHLATLMET